MSSQVLIREIEPEVFQQLKKRAKQHGRSFEAELRFILKEAATKEKNHSSMLAESQKVRSMFKGQKLSSSVGLIREDRNR